MTYVVKAPYITLTTGTAQGPAVLGFYEGAVVPDDVPEEQLKHHLDADLIEEADAEALSTGTEDSAPAEDQSEPPARSASKEVWLDYARSQGASDEDLEGQSRDDLAARYGR